MSSRIFQYISLTLGAGLLFAVIAGFWAFPLPNVYRSEAVIRGVSGDFSGPQLVSLDLLVKGRTNIASIQNSLDHPLDVETIRENISLSNAGDGRLSIAFKSEDSAVANEVVSDLISYVQLEGPVLKAGKIRNELRSAGNESRSTDFHASPAYLIEKPPHTPNSPAGPRRLLIVGGAFSAGLFLGLLLSAFMAIRHHNANRLF